MSTDSWLWPWEPWPCTRWAMRARDLGGSLRGVQHSSSAAMVSFVTIWIISGERALSSLRPNKQQLETGKSRKWSQNGATCCVPAACEGPPAYELGRTSFFEFFDIGVLAPAATNSLFQVSTLLFFECLHQCRLRGLCMRVASHRILLLVLLSIHEI